MQTFKQNVISFKKTLDTIYGPQKRLLTTSSACMALAMALAVAVKSPTSSSWSFGRSVLGKPGSRWWSSCLERNCAVAKAAPAPWRIPWVTTSLTQAGTSRRRSSRERPLELTALTASNAASWRVSRWFSRADTCISRSNNAKICQNKKLWI